MNERIVRIGGASAHGWDSATAVPQLIARNAPDYLIFDYLSEGAMGQLAKLGEQGPDHGYSPDFITTHMQPNLAAIMAKKVKVIANAGGVNPRAGVAALQKAAADLGLKPKIVAVEGDDLRHRADELREAGYREMFSGAPFPDTIGSLNAYLGAFPIAEALSRGADIVLTGRVVDSALVLGILIHEFGWGPADYDLLAAGTAIGHLIECGTHCTGGTFTDWELVPQWDNVGFPIAECRADGSCVITKPEDTGGLVSVGTVTEQLFYEVSDPQAYIVPDVTCDFSAITVEQVGPDRVLVSNAKGLPPTDSYKVCIVYEKGWRAVAQQPIFGFDAPAKARRQAAALLEKTGRMLREQNLGEWVRTHVDLVGAGSSFGAHAPNEDAREVVCRVVVDHDDVRAAGLFAREQNSAMTAMAVGTTIGLGTTVTPLMHIFLFLIPRSEVSISIWDNGVSEPYQDPAIPGFDPAMIDRPAPPPAPRWAPDEEIVTVPLIRLAWGRSGDKGNLFNVAAIARKPDYLPYISEVLTTEAVGEWFAHLYRNPASIRVDRYDAPGTDTINFVVHDSMDGGINNTPRIDGAAKTMAQQLLAMPVRVPAWLAEEVGQVGPSARSLEHA